MSRFWREQRMASAGLLLLAGIVLLTLFPQWLTGHSPTLIDSSLRLSPPDATHWLGTDLFGRDVLARLLHGGRYTLSIGLGVVLLSFILGVAIGTLSGYCGGWVDSLCMRCVDALLSFPSLVLAIALAAAFGPSLLNAMFAVTLTLAPRFARLARGQALSIVVKPYVEAGLALGVSHSGLLLRYILRNGLGPLLVQASLSVGSAILQTASLGFLGLGAQPPQPEWGSDLASSLQYLDDSPWLALAPGLAILLTVLAFNLTGDALADWLNPRQRRRH